MDPSIERDLNEIWDLVDRAPDALPFKEGDGDGYYLDLLVRAGKKMRQIPEIVEAINYLLAKHAFSGLVRPVVMMITRSINSAVSERLCRR